MKNGTRALVGVLALACVVISAFVLRAARRPLRHANDVTAPLTDVAGPAPSVSLRPDENPERRLARFRAEAGTAPVAREKIILPSVMDVAHPPQWTRPRAIPGPPVRPDPWTPPVFSANAERGQHSNVE